MKVVTINPSTVSSEMDEWYIRFYKAPCCGKDVARSFKFCPYCGAKFVWTK